MTRKGMAFATKNAAAGFLMAFLRPNEASPPPSGLFLLRFPKLCQWIKDGGSEARQKSREPGTYSLPLKFWAPIKFISSGINNVISSCACRIQASVCAAFHILRCSFSGRAEGIVRLSCASNRLVNLHEILYIFRQLHASLLS